MADVLRVEDLRVAFSLQGQPHEVLRGISLRVPKGKVVALVGESGSGKSVTSQAAMGLLPASASVTSGHITFSDPDSNEQTIVTDIPRDGPVMRGLRGARMSMIFQEPMNSLSPLHTIGDQVSEMLTVHDKIDLKAAREKTEDILARVGFPDPNAAFDRYAFELSGGLRQRAMIAMALICNPALLIADEPTTALDVTIQAQVLGLLKELRRDYGMAMLLITHDLGVVANMADEVVVIYHGEIMEAGPVEPIFRNPKHPYLRALLRAVPHFDMKPGERLQSLRDIETPLEDVATIRDLPGVKAPDRTVSAKVRDGEAASPILELKNLTKTFVAKKGQGWFGGGAEVRVRAVNDVSLSIRAGECLGLVGESGCGKTTLSKLIMRALTPDLGQVRLADRTGEMTDLTALTGRQLDEHRRRIQLVFQDPVNSLSPRMTVLNILCEPLEIAGIGTHAERVKRAVALMKAVGLDPRFLGRYPHSFSGGQRQRIGIARALALAPDVMICDEPVSALDVSVQAQVLNLLNDLRRELGLTYLFVSHNLAVIDYVADRIAVMARGRIVELAPRAALFSNPQHPYTQRLLSAVPYPDLDRPLDFQKLGRADASDPQSWPIAFRSIGDGANDRTPSDVHNGASDKTDQELAFVTVGEGHHVLRRPDVSASERNRPAMEIAE
ncbi:MAG: ABC transporter ATP-binding protein [Pseudomonadota bacterium]